MPRPLLPVLLAPLAAGCLLEADLPPDWEDAEPVAALVQTECGGDPYEGADERLEAEGGGGEVSLSYREAHFRCEQEVEAFYLLEGDTLSVLVQPIDMDPGAVAGCDCLYDVDITVDGLEVGALNVALFRRWDNLNDPNDPVAIDSAEVEVE
jgi:hypothetical protein